MTTAVAEPRTPAFLPPPAWPFGWVWQAVHRDATVVNEYDPDGMAHGFGEVDQANLEAIHLWPVQPGLPHFMTQVPSGCTPVYCRRRGVIVQTGEETPAWHLLGWRRGDVVSVLFIAPDGSAFMSDDFNAV